MNPNLTLYVARHGQTRLNREQRFQGSLDEALDDLGLKQAEALAERLPADIRRIVSSPLLRARQTAACVAARLGLEVDLMEAFREHAYGVFEGLNREELELHHPELWHGKVVRQWDAAPPGGESMREMQERVAAGLVALSAAQAGEQVLLVAHGFVARMIHHVLNAQAEQAFHDLPMLGNAEFAVYELSAQPGHLR